MPETLLHKVFDATAGTYPDAEFVVQRKRRTAYRDILSQANRLARFLSGGIVSPGDRIGLLLENSPEYVSCYYGVLKAAGTVVPLDVHVPGKGLEILLRYLRPKAVIVGSRNAEKLIGLRPGMPSMPRILVVPAETDAGKGKKGETEASNADACVTDIGTILTSGPDDFRFEGARCNGDSPAMIIVTSGTTGSPKGVVLSHRNLSSNARSIVRYLHLSRTDRVMAVLPFHYSYGNSLLTTHAAVGGALILENSLMYPNVVLERMVEERATGFSGVPSTFVLLLNNSNMKNMRFPELRYLTQAGGPMSSRHISELLRAIPGADLYVMYGQTEASARLSYLDPRDLPRKIGSIGKAIPGVTLTLKTEDGRDAMPGEVGEIVARGENVMLGYWESPEETLRALRPDGLHTGDFAKADEEGFLYIVGRRTDMIKSGAHRISARDVEETILTIPEVHEVAVVGVEDEVLGEAVMACIVPVGKRVLERQEIMARCREYLPPYKCPKFIVFCDELPKTPSGKIKKHQLAKGQYVPPKSVCPRKDCGSTQTD